MVAGDFQVSAALLVDQLSIVMALVVTGIGFLIHVYSIGYMHDDPRVPRFFAYLNLFILMMLVLVLADNYLMLYVGWEGVGLASYLLIGFWYEKPSAADAGKKAFLVNRVGDVGLLIAIMIIWTSLGTLQFNEVFERAEALWAVGGSIVVTVTLLMLLGATGKSAQIPLFVWLPDAMEGPTPVSALIHAATMVTAGVYLVARSALIFASVPSALLVVGAIGTFTALFAAIIGICQKDIKKVLAYSTVSQLGYMFMALGVGAWAVAIFHLVTHAFFKALLFLGAGSVIHSLGGEQDMDRMGGLRRRVPATFVTLFAGALALSGIPPLAGFWSKDEILGSAWQDGKYVFWIVGLITAFITAFYTFRLIYLTFWGKPRMDAKTAKHVHESPWSMVLPLVVLALGSLGVGFLSVPGQWGLIQSFLGPVFASADHVLGVEEHGLSAVGIVLIVISVLVAALGIVLAWVMYVKRTDLPGLVSARLKRTYGAVFNKFYVDEFYGATFVRAAVDGSRWVWHKFDELVIDGAVNGTAWLWQRAGTAARPLQTGRVQNYLLAMFIGLFIIVTVVVFL